MRRKIESKTTIFTRQETMMNKENNSKVLILKEDTSDKITISLEDALSIVRVNKLNIDETILENVVKYIKNNYYESGKIKFCKASKRVEEDKEVCKIPIVREEVIPIYPSKPKEFNFKGLKASALKFFMEKELEHAVYESFSDMIFRFIDEKGFSDTEVYKRVSIDRRLFSKLRLVKEYNPSRDTAIKLAIALELDLLETESLIKKAGYAIGNSNKRDLIIKYFIENRIYNLTMLNEMLFAFGEDTLD